MAIYQVLEALDYGDGVSNDVISKSRVLTDLGYETGIYSKWINEKVEKYRTSVELLKPSKSDIILFHFSQKSSLLNKVKSLKCKKVLVYHNVTPPQFFESYRSEQFRGCTQECSEGLQQLKKNIKYFDYFLADSEFNKQDLLNMGASDIDVLPIFIDFKVMKTFSIVKEIVEGYQNRDVILFVGRVVPNKRHKDIIDTFDYYYRKISNNAVLIFVGNHSDYSEYYSELLSKLMDLKCKNNVVFTDKVENSELYTYYQIAKAFLCMSEHEGFCIPLLESMNFEIPTIAYDASAVSATMGGSGVLFYEKDIPTIAELLNVVIKNVKVRGEIISKQNLWIKNFTENAIKDKIDKLIKKWID